MKSFLSSDQQVLLCCIVENMLHHKIINAKFFSLNTFYDGNKSTPLNALTFVVGFINTVHNDLNYAVFQYRLPAYF